jgi:hypothetical protein
MPTATQIYRQLEDLAQRHERLRKKFLDFFELAGYLATRASRIQGVVLDGHLDDNFFNVSFCGHTFQFTFSLALDEAGASRGTVSCFSADPIETSKRKLVTSFSYSGTGVTDVPNPGDIEDQITIDSDVGAVFLVCYCLHNGLTK